jgi:hypothetical protein
MASILFRAVLLAGLLSALTTGAEATAVYNDMNTNTPIVVNAVADSQNGPLFASFTAPTPNSNIMTELQLVLSAGNDAGGILITVYDDFDVTPSSPLAFGFVSDAAINAAQGSDGWAAIDLPAFVPLLDQDCACDDSTFWIGVADAQDAARIATAGGITPTDPFPASDTSAIWANDGNNSYPLESNFVTSNEPQVNLNQDTNAFVMCVVVDGGQLGGCAASSVPEPGSFTLIGLALAGLGLVRLRGRGV